MKATKGTPISTHLSRLVIDTMCKPGKANVRASNFALWIETYGETVADQVRKDVTAHWQKKGYKGEPFHPMLVGLYRSVKTGEK